jgi:hypothetical protein
MTPDSKTKPIPASRSARPEECISVPESTLTPLLSPKRTGRIVRRHPKTLGRWRRDGIGPDFVLINGRPAYEEDAIRRWLDQQRRTSTSD